MLNKVISKAKREEDKKVPINFLTKEKLKEQFDVFCKENKVSVTAMLNSLMEYAVARIDKNDLYRRDLKELINELEEEYENHKNIASQLEHGRFEQMENGGPLVDFEVEVEMSKQRIDAILEELNERRY